MKLGKLIMVANSKGGAGKSTLANLIASLLDNCVLGNIDQTQSVEDINAGGYSVDLIEEDMDAVGMIRESQESADYVIVDTPSNWKPGQVDYERIMSLLNDVDLFIIPFKKGNRNIKNTILSIDYLFGEGSTARTKPIKFLFILTDIKATGTKKDTLNKAQEYVEDNLVSQLRQINFTADVDDIYIDYVMNSGAIIKIEDEDVTLSDLYAKNKGIYGPLHMKITEIAENIKNILGEQHD